MFWKLLLMLFLQIHKDRGLRAKTNPIDDWLSEEPSNDWFPEKPIDVNGKEFNTMYGLKPLEYL